jgi:hypothetical protein
VGTGANVGRSRLLSRPRFDRGKRYTEAPRARETERSSLRTHPGLLHGRHRRDHAELSPSAAKPKAVVESLRARGLSIEVVAPEPVSRSDLVRTHDPAFVDGVLSGNIQNGFGNTDAAVAAWGPSPGGSLH